MLPDDRLIDSRGDKRDLVRDLGLLYGIAVAVVFVLLAWWRPWRPDYEVADQSDIFSAVAGTWDWSGADGFCSINPHTITFSPDHDVMMLRFREPWTDSVGIEHQVAEYEIREHTRNRIRGFIRGETRRTPDGRLVVWDLVLTGPDVYRWHRTDWAVGGYTKDVLRCKAGRGGAH